MIRLTACLRTGDLTAAAAAASRAELMLGGVPDAALARHRDLSRRVLSGRAAVELWSGQLDEAARLLEAAAAGAAAGGEDEHAGWAGQLALVEALRGRLGRAADLAGQAATGRRAAAAWPGPGRRAARRARLGAPAAP